MNEIDKFVVEKLKDWGENIIAWHVDTQPKWIESAIKEAISFGKKLGKEERDRELREKINLLLSKEDMRTWQAAYRVLEEVLSLLTNKDE